MNENIKKVIRFTSIYGPSRTFTKIAGRMRFGPLLNRFQPKKQKDISIVGCGQFAFSTICYFLKKKYGNRFLSCYDIDIKHSQSLGDFYGFDHVENSFTDLLKRNPKYLYIASNHHSHVEYAIEALKNNIDVYIEKPVSVNIGQFRKLLAAIQQSDAAIYAGYNRPFAKAIIDIGPYIKNKRAPLSINYFISGHKIESDHWYRDSREGTRICGNVGHWLDLTIHFFALRDYMPERIDIDIAYSSQEEADDNIAITLTTDLNDIVTIMLTSRSEPFEGINESINLQCDDVIVKIDDFRRLTLWQGSNLVKKRYWPKDVGHKRAILQPFTTSIQNKRNWNEVELSTLLMLYITDMVLNREHRGSIEIQKELDNIKQQLKNNME